MGGTSSVRGWGSCDLAVSRSFVEGTAEYRFPVWRMISGAPDIILQTGNLYSAVPSTKLLLTAKSQDPQPLTDDVPPIQKDS